MVSQSPAGLLVVGLDTLLGGVAAGLFVSDQLSELVVAHLPPVLVLLDEDREEARDLLAVSVVRTVPHALGQPADVLQRVLVGVAEEHLAFLCLGVRHEDESLNLRRVEQTATRREEDTQLDHGLDDVPAVSGIGGTVEQVAHPVAEVGVVDPHGGNGREALSLGHPDELDDQLGVFTFPLDTEALDLPPVDVALGRVLHLVLSPNELLELLSCPLLHGHGKHHFSSNNSVMSLETLRTTNNIII